MKRWSRENQVKFVLIVNRYFTPFAILLVGFGLALSQPHAWVMWSSIGLVAFTSALNIGTASLVRARGGVSPGLAALRLYTNLGVNCILVYLLGGYWTPIWLLFVLTPAATALYGSRERTVWTSIGVAVLLLVSHAFRRLNAPVDWGVATVEALFMVFLALFLNELSTWLRSADAAAE
jgi:hypothetical protein